MMTSNWKPQEYLEEELLSLDRLKRAVSNRIFARAESLMGEGEEYLLNQEKTDLIIEEEWKRAKDAVKSSRVVRDNLRKQWENSVAKKIDSLMATDKDELSTMGVVKSNI